jgi:hypothetical protein
MSNMIMYGVSALTVVATAAVFGTLFMTSGSTSKAEGKRPPAVTLIVALPMEHHDSSNFEAYKKVKYDLLKTRFSVSDAQLDVIKRRTYEGIKYDESKAGFERIGEDHAGEWKTIIVTFDRFAENYVQMYAPAVVVSHGDSMAYHTPSSVSSKRHVVLSPVVPMANMPFDTEFTQGLYSELQLAQEDRYAVATDRYWSKFAHPGIRGMLDRARQELTPPE